MLTAFHSQLTRSVSSGGYPARSSDVSSTIEVIDGAIAQCAMKPSGRPTLPQGALSTVATRWRPYVNGDARRRRARGMEACRGAESSHRKRRVLSRQRRERELWVLSRQRRERTESADKPGSVVDSHSSRRIVADTLKQPTRRHRGPRHCLPIWSCSRWGLPCRSVAGLAVRSYRTISPLPVPTPEDADHRRYLSVALSVGSRRPGVTWHRALWSPDFPRHPPPPKWLRMTRLPGRLRAALSHVRCTQSLVTNAFCSSQGDEPRFFRRAVLGKIR